MKDYPHYESRALRKNQSDRSLPCGAFRLKHYAGSVSWIFIVQLATRFSEWCHGIKHLLHK